MKENVFTALERFYRFFNSWTGTIIFVLLMIFFVAQAFRIPSGSMKNSLLIGDFLFAKKFAYGISTPRLPFLEIPLIPGTDGHIIDGDRPKRGDIVIFRYPNNTKLHYVKRCVAVGGDELFVNNKNLYLHPKEGDAYIQSHYEGIEKVEAFGKLWLKNPYQKAHPGIHHDPAVINYGYEQMTPLFSMAPVKVPNDEFFMMGDNRDHSNDSRFWGTVPYGLVEGTPWFIYLSMDDNYVIRWERVGKTPQDLEQEEFIKRAQREESEGGIY